MKHWLTMVMVMLLASALHAREVAHLANGDSLRCVRHEQHGGTTRLHLEDGAFIDVPSAQISEFEVEAEPLPAAIPDYSAAEMAQTPRAVQPPAAAPVLPAAGQPFLRGQILSASARNGVDADFIASVIHAESGFNAKAVSAKGARGLMQLMPATAASLGTKDSFDPAQNIEGGSRYLRQLLVQFNGDAALALAAYNAGPQRVENYKGVPPFAETRKYVARVIHDYNRRKTSAATPASGVASASSAAIPAAVSSNANSTR